MAALRVATLMAVLAAAPLAAPTLPEAESCPALGGGPPGCQQDHSLLQVEPVRMHKVRKHRTPVTTDCATRLSEHISRPAACLVIHGDKALLVRVPYGKHPGWDLPGGHEHTGEPACEAAEREVCEETGHSARAISRISYNVYLCELNGDHVCTQAVDEGFLDKGWYTAVDLEGLTMRGHSWGDKEGLIRSHLAAAGDGGHGGHGSVGVGGDGGDEVDEIVGTDDIVGEGQGMDAGVTGTAGTTPCTSGGATAAAAATTRTTTPGGSTTAAATRIAGDARAGDGLDLCGCRLGQEGWSTSRHSCVAGSWTDEREAAACQASGAYGGGDDSADLDECGCRKGQEGWSTWRRGCAVGGTTDEREAAVCRG